MIEKAIAEDIKLEEFELVFPDDPSKKVSLMHKIRHDAPSSAAAGTSASQDVRSRHCLMSLADSVNRLTNCYVMSWLCCLNVRTMRHRARRSAAAAVAKAATQVRRMRCLFIRM